jgi:hypothetical protein
MASYQTTEPVITDPTDPVDPTGCPTCLSGTPPRDPWLDQVVIEEAAL